MLSRPGKSQGLLYKQPRHWFIHWFIDSVSQPFPPIVLQRRHAQTVRNSSSSYKVDYVKVIKTILNPEGHQNLISGSKATAISLKGCILPIGGASSVEGLRSTGIPRLVWRYLIKIMTIRLKYFKDESVKIPYLFFEGCRLEILNLSIYKRFFQFRGYLG